MGLDRQAHTGCAGTEGLQQWCEREAGQTSGKETPSGSDGESLEGMKQAEQRTKDTEVDQAVRDMALHTRLKFLQDEWGTTEDL